MTMTVKETKVYLASIIKKLSEFADDEECCIEISDNCGGSYSDCISSFTVEHSNVFPIVFIQNF